MKRFSLIWKLSLNGLGWAIVLLFAVGIQPSQAANQLPEDRPIEPSPAANPPAKKQPIPQPVPPIRTPNTCPTAIEPLTQALLKDLPQYINRLRHQRRGSQSWNYAIVASQPNLQPLPVVTNYPNPEQGGLYQVFFTVLERQYDTRKKIDYQNYYWLFLANTAETGWTLAILYRRSSSYPSNNSAPSPLQDATSEVPGLAIRQWLRDCEAGSV